MFQVVILRSTVLQYHPDRKRTRFYSLKIAYMVYCLLGPTLVNTKLNELIPLSLSPDGVVSRCDMPAICLKPRMASEKVSLSSDPEAQDC